MTLAVCPTRFSSTRPLFHLAPCISTFGSRLRPILAIPNMIFHPCIISPLLSSPLPRGSTSRYMRLSTRVRHICFVSSRIVEINGFKPYAINPITLRYLDGSSSIISEMLRLPILFPSGDVQHMDFYVTRLDAPSDLVLGYNWLRCFNPLIDWSTGNISFRPNVIPDVSLSTPQANMPVLDSENLGRPAENKPSETSSPAPAPSMEFSPGPEPSLPSASTSPPHISLVSAAAYSVALKQSGSTQYILRPVPRDTIGGRSASVKPDLSGLPAEYQDFADVFSEKEADTLPPH